VAHLGTSQAAWIFFFSAYAPAVAEGYRATIEALDKLGRPVQALRRRPSIEEQMGQEPRAGAAR